MLHYLRSSHKFTQHTRWPRLVSILLACLLLCNCTGNATEAGYTLYAREDINLGADANSQAAALTLHVMQITDLYTNRLSRLEYVPDTSEMRLGAEKMRSEHRLYTRFITDLCSALYNSRPIIGKVEAASIIENETDMEFNIDVGNGVRYEGRLDYDLAACYAFRYEGESWEYYRVIGDASGYYMELLAAYKGQWYIHRAYYSPRRWYNACAPLDEAPEPDLVYHYLPDNFEQHIKGMPQLVCRMEYTLGKQLQYWDYNYGHELYWDLLSPTPTPVI